ncbi:MAG: restriction endonuclease subunit S [Xanthobacteraceae bacterium]
MVDRRDVLHKALHDLPKGWEWEWFTDVMDVEGGTQPPASEFVDEPQPGYVRLVQIRDFETDNHATYIPDSRKWRKCETSDILIARYGASLGRICSGLKGAYNVALAKVVPTERIHLPFAYHLLRSNYFQGPLMASGGRSAQAGFNKHGLSTIPLPVPPVPTQIAIAHILGTLDDKIELNRRMNETLGTMLRALFKSWFVDFDPVRARAEGRNTGLPSAVTKLFVSSLEDSELGEIPTGWRVGRLEEVASVIMGLSPSGDSYNTEAIGTPLINGPVEFGEYFPAKSKWTTHPTRMSTQGDLVLCVRGSTTGRRIVADGAYCLGRGVCAIRPRSVGRTFLYELISSQLDRLLSKTTGSVFPSLSSPDIKRFTIVVPDPRVLLEFDRVAEPFTDRAEANILTSRTLMSLRDALLPKLISSELRLKDAEKFVAA